MQEVDVLYPQAEHLALSEPAASGNNGYGTDSVTHSRRLSPAGRSR